MQLYPTRTAAHLAITGIVVVGVGIAVREPAIVGWGGALVLAVAVGRAVTLASVARIRAAGFEMLWTGPRRVIRVARGSTVEIEAEVRNRDTLAARFVKLRAVASSQIRTTIEPAAGEVAASGSLKVKVKVLALRVGQHGVHGLALEVHGASGLFEVPLTFANPYGIEVIPRPFAVFLLQPRGGRSHLVAASGRPGKSRGEGTDLRELREHQPGDPFRHIAWKASAKRPQLLVRAFEREERDVVWVVLSAPVELWAGPVGRAPLDFAIDEVASITSRHLGRGDRVGAVIASPSGNVVIPPDQGPAQAQRIANALITAASTYDADRSDLDEADVAVRVLEHLRPLDPRGLTDVRRGDLDKLASRADSMRARAPFAANVPNATTLRDRTLRRYLASFGIDSPPRVEPDRRDPEGALADALQRIAQIKPRASIVHVVAPPPDDAHQAKLGEAIRRVKRRGAAVSWSFPPFEPALSPPWDDRATELGDEDEPRSDARKRAAFLAMAPIAAEAIRIRARTAQVRREAALKKLGVRVLRVRPVSPARATELSTERGNAASSTEPSP